MSNFSINGKMILGMKEFRAAFIKIKKDEMVRIREIKDQLSFRRTSRSSSSARSRPRTLLRYYHPSL